MIAPNPHVKLIDYFNSTYIQAKGLTKLSERAYRSAIKQFHEFLGEFCSTDIETLERVPGFSAWLCAVAGVTPKTAHDYRKAVVAVLSHANGLEEAEQKRRDEIANQPPPPDSGEMLLAHWVASYGRSRSLRPQGPRQLMYSVAHLQRFANKPLTLDDLSDDLLNGWIAARHAQGMAPKTVHSQRGHILTLWREAHRRRLVKAGPQYIQPVKVPKPRPRAYTPEELATLLHAFDKMEDKFYLPIDLENSSFMAVPKRLLLRAFLLTAYESGLRPCDLRALRTTDITSDRIVILQTKTQEPKEFCLSAEAMRALHATHPEQRALVFPLGKMQLGRAWKSACNSADLPGTPRWVRRAGATAIMRMTGNPNAVASFLGHTSPQNQVHYVDPRQITSVHPVPPPIVESQPSLWSMLRGLFGKGGGQ